MLKALNKAGRCGVRSDILLSFIFLCLSVLATAMNARADRGLSGQMQSGELEEARRLNAEAIRLNLRGRYDDARPLAQRALAIREKALGPDHRDVAISLGNLAQLYYAKGDYTKAEPLYQRALAIFEKVRGPDHSEVATTLNNLAALYYKKGDYTKAEPLFQRALAIWEKALGPDHHYVATALNNLAEFYNAKADYAKAEALYQRALVIQEKASGPDHPDIAATLNNLGDLYKARADYVKAEPLFQRALSIWEKVLGPDHPDVAATLNNLAQLYESKADYEKADLFYKRALTIREKMLGPAHPYVAQSLNNLAALYESKKNYTRAGPLFQRALSIWEKAFGPDHPEVATALNNLANLYYKEGNFTKAEPLFQRALAIFEKALGPDHPDVAHLLNSLAGLYEAKNDLPRALASLLRATDISERNVALNLATGSERQKLLYLETFSNETDWTVSFQVQSAQNDLSARRLALTTILRRKGRALDAMADSIGALRNRLNPLRGLTTSTYDILQLIQQFTNARSQLATLVLGGPDKMSPAQHQTEVKRLEDQVERLEAEISLQSVAFRIQSQAVTMESVQGAIPRDAALVEFVSFRRHNPKQSNWESRSYAAYVLTSQGEPASVDLGEAEKIDTAVGLLREALRDPDRADVRSLARAVDEKVMQPVRRILGKTRTLLISPEGALNLIPFGALVDEQNRYLIEQYSLTYLTTGRDLLRMQTRTKSLQGAMVIADPDFGELATAESNRDLKVKKGDAGPGQQTAQNAVDFSQVYFGALPGTAEEAKALRVILPEAKMLVREQATEATLKQMVPPSILHIATHGFFLEDVVINPAEKSGRGLLVKTDQAVESVPPGVRVENPLLRSGLAMAGANLHKNGDDDGVLTALEVAGLNLWGTKLVVLSACDTGVGEVRNGEGVYGLRRALVLAGSESQVMSLWPVSDEGTRDLMIGYYKELEAGEGRREALRQVQLSMLASKERRHPYYWASFIQSGEWANLDGKR